MCISRTLLERKAEEQNGQANCLDLDSYVSRGRPVVFGTVIGTSSWHKLAVNVGVIVLELAVAESSERKQE